MKVFQKEVTLQPYPRGYHIVTNELVRDFPEIKEIDKGLLQVFIKHTSASLTINENADPSVRTDFKTHIDRLFPENEHYVHSIEGSDDMPAHLKTAVLDHSLTIPITNGRLNLGTWQGIYLCEHRDYGGSRSVVLTAMGL